MTAAHGAAMAKHEIMDGRATGTLKMSPPNIAQLLPVCCLIFASWQALGAPTGAPDVAPGGARGAPDQSVVAGQPHESHGPHTFMGTKRCRMCHTDQHKSWLASRKANSWDALKPHVSEEIKRKAGLDTARSWRRWPGRSA